MALVDGTLLESIYEGPLEDVPWQGFVVLLRQRFELVACSLHLRLPGPDQRGFDVSDSDWDVRALREHYEGHYYQYNPFSYDDMQAGVVYRWTDFISRERFIQTEYYREFCQPVGFEYALALGIDEPSGMKIWLSGVRNTEQGDFSEGEESHFLQLFPHLQRALRLLAKIQRSESEKLVYRATVDQMAIGTLVLDHLGNIISANDAARAMAASDPALDLNGKRLRLSDRQLDQHLATLIVAMLAEPESGNAEALSLSRRGEPALGLLLRVFPAGSQIETQHRPALIIYLTDPTSHQLAPQQLVSQLFGLTNAEARLATLLANGLSLAEAAETMHVSEGSARSYCKRIYAKTGLKRQAELVRLVLKSVASLATV